ncbi:hypothetical protein SBA2_150025 [Acidobacteriia bacterium SbA2]|nr:hypothetical protein SBA2_150025 [Acidobacteriia bacterium SbA2]
MPVILSEAKDPGSFLWFSDLRTTAEILRCAQDDTSEFPHTFSRPGLLYFAPSGLKCVI